MNSYADFDVVDYIEADDEERSAIDDEFKPEEYPDWWLAMHCATPHQSGMTNWR
jgi:hypothetical protein